MGGGNGETIASQFNDRQALKAIMNDIADQTGGEAFMGTNDFAQALRRSIGDGSNYYSLAGRRIDRPTYKAVGVLVLDVCIMAKWNRD